MQTKREKINWKKMCSMTDSNGFAKMNKTEKKKLTNLRTL